jgi:hypothetical protein
MLSDLEDAKKLTHILTRHMGEKETIVDISIPFPEHDV